MAGPVARGKPIIVYLSCRRPNGIGKQGQDILALPKVACQIGAPGEQPDRAVPVAELALEPFGLVRVVLVSLQVAGARALVGAHVAGEHLSLLVNVGDMLVAHVRGREPF